MIKKQLSNPEAYQNTVFNKTERQVNSSLADSLFLDNLKFQEAIKYDKGPEAMTVVVMRPIHTVKCSPSQELGWQLTPIAHLI